MVYNVSKSHERTLMPKFRVVLCRHDKSQEKPREIYDTRSYFPHIVKNRGVPLREVKVETRTHRIVEFTLSPTQISRIKKGEMMRETTEALKWHINRQLDPSSSSVLYWRTFFPDYLVEKVEKCKESKQVRRRRKN